MSTPAKKMCFEHIQELSSNHIIQQLVMIHNSFNEKVKHLEAKIDTFVLNIKVILAENLTNEKKLHCCDKVLEKLVGIESLVQNIYPPMHKEDQSKQLANVPVVLLPTPKPNREGDSNIQVVTLNSKEDYPGGSWLGDDNNPGARVRVPITPSNLVHINTICTTPEKMALLLLDRLFSQETLAKSNLTGKGKHFKEQLDPLKIYGIKAHLMYKFKITEWDWYRIKQNIDSKCRTAWRKRAMGLPLSKNKVKIKSEQISENILKGNDIDLSTPFISEENAPVLSRRVKLKSEQVSENILKGNDIDLPTPFKSEENAPVLSTMKDVNFPLTQESEQIQTTRNDNKEMDSICNDQNSNDGIILGLPT